MWTFPVHQEQREMAAMQLGKEHFCKSFPSFFFLPFLPCLLLHYCFSKNVSPYVLLFNLQTDSSELWIWKWKNGNTPQKRPLTLWRQASTQILGAVITIHFCFQQQHHITAAFFCFSPFGSLHADLFLCCFRICLYFRTFQFLWLHCTTSTECMMIA